MMNAAQKNPGELGSDEPEDTKHARLTMLIKRAEESLRDASSVTNAARELLAQTEGLLRRGDEELKGERGSS